MPFQFFILMLVSAFLGCILIQLIDYSINTFTVMKLFEEFGRALNLSLFFTFNHTINSLKKTISPEDFKIERKKFIFYFFIICFTVTECFILLKQLLFSGDLKWGKIIIIGLVMSIVQIGLVVVLSEYLQYKSKKTLQRW